ncbi:hypothetical protein [Myxacorys almedinensis]|uniref:Uncharacterized protein n=1 Tax=Myxacorys almedinensis A TaxID=2690445 RepID=A0A8J7Z1Q8_9CYAN|nr:hypothetical protein [Myxacorys almedinensis]NDJ16561.1 hypothetical protein [Myxacorys almedinensis A]
MKRLLAAWVGVLVFTSPVLGEEASSIDLDPSVLQTSPVLQRWLKDVPNVADDIQNDPSFRTRLRLGYLRFSPDANPGLAVGIEDLRIGQTRLTLSGNYQTTFKGQSAIDTHLTYYLRPLGSYVNVAPMVGYRHLETDRYSTSGATLGVRVLFVLSRGGGADVALSQSWVAPGSDSEIGLSRLSFGYAVTHHLRLSTDFQRQNSRQGRDDRIGIGLEWLP